MKLEETGLRHEVDKEMRVPPYFQELLDILVDL